MAACNSQKSGKYTTLAQRTWHTVDTQYMLVEWMLKRVTVQYNISSRIWRLSSIIPLIISWTCFQWMFMGLRTLCPTKDILRLPVLAYLFSLHWYHPPTCSPGSTDLLSNPQMSAAFCHLRAVAYAFFLCPEYNLFSSPHHHWLAPTHPWGPWIFQSPIWTSI